MPDARFRPSEFDGSGSLFKSSHAGGTELARSARVEPHPARRFRQQNVLSVFFKRRAMDEIANAIGLVACQVIGGFVPRCLTGESLAVVGYWTAALVICFLGGMAFIDRNR